MAEKEEIQGELYQGAEFDTIEIPDEAKTILADQDAAHEGKPEQQEQKEGEKQDTAEERRARKRNDYQKRLNELVRQKHEAEERAAAAEAKAELLEQRRAEAEKGATESTVAILKQREQELIERRREAEKTGDLGEYSKASDELFEIRGRMRPQPVEQERPPERGNERRETGSVIPEAMEWMEANPWFQQKENSHLVSEVVRIQNDLLRKGYNLDIPAQAKKLFEKINEEIRKRPEFDSVLGGTEEEIEETEQRPAPRNHIAPPSRGGEAPVRTKPGELSEYDKRAMRMVGIDPNDPKARAAYIKRKRA